MRITAVRPLITLVFLLAAGISPAAAQQATSPRPANRGPELNLITPAFSDGGDIPVKYTCSAKPSAVSPALQWTGAPKETASFALIFHDPEMNPNKGMFDVTHWMLWNLAATAAQLPEGVPANAKLEDGAQQGKNVTGANAYLGPCPPPGKPHHYIFELYALDQKLDLAPDATRADLLRAMDGHVIGKGVYIGLFHR
jgi:Raf kinase inhibitor-like YbhB/YbcL family protein